MKFLRKKFIFVVVFLLAKNIGGGILVNDDYMKTALRENNKDILTSDQEADFEKFLTGDGCPNCNLSNLIMTNVELPKKTDYTGANFSNCDLRGCIFRDVDLSNAHFNNATIFSTIFEKSKFDNTDFTNAMLTNANLEETTGENTNFTNARCYITRFGRANLPKVIFVNTNLVYADFLYTKIPNAVGLAVQRTENGMPILKNPGQNQLYINPETNAPTHLKTLSSPTARLCATTMPLEQFSSDMPAKNILVAFPDDNCYPGFACSRDMLIGQYSEFDDESYAINLDANA